MTTHVVIRNTLSPLMLPCFTAQLAALDAYLGSRRDI
jgi:hypothetical protein